MSEGRKIPPRELRVLGLKCNDEWDLTREDLRAVLEAVPGADVHVAGGDPRHWYSNGPVAPRWGVLAAYHSLIHIARWEEIQEEAKALAINLKRWVWVCMAETRWAYVQLGPVDGSAPSLASDQYIYKWSPEGVGTLAGVS